MIRHRVEAVHASRVGRKDVIRRNAVQILGIEAQAAPFTVPRNVVCEENAAADSFDALESPNIRYQRFVDRNRFNERALAGA